MPAQGGLSHKAIENFILSLPNAQLGYPFGEDVAVYFVKTTPDAEDRGKMFALIQEDKKPVQLSLKCDPQLAETLREKYDTVMPGYHLNKKHWNTILLTGQLSQQEIQDLIRHSYSLVTSKKQIKL